MHSIELIKKPPLKKLVVKAPKTLGNDFNLFLSDDTDLVGGVIVNDEKMNLVFVRIASDECGPVDTEKRIPT